MGYTIKIMHELSLVENILEILHEHIKIYGLRKVSKVSVLVGDKLYVDSDCLEFAFKVASSGTAVQNAKLEILPVKDSFEMVLETIEGE
jgi:Zn finger protein HypA/HybF involved in hydrogenase expression